MQDHVVPSPPAENSQGSIALLRLLIARHPYASMVFFLVYWLVLLLALGRVLGPLYYSLHIPYLMYDALGELALALIVALPLILLKWWPEAGFTRGINGNGMVICLLPILFIVGPVALGIGSLVGYVSAPVLIYAVTLALLVGFAEEGMFRGIILRTLLPRGIWPAVIVSALCFACVHLTNLLTGASIGYVAEQLILAFGAGIIFAALRLRTRSIWPCILLHAARDVIGLAYFGMNPRVIQAEPSITVLTVDIVFFLIYLTISLVLLRPKQLRKLQVIYGLAQEPAPAPTYPYPTYQPPTTPYPGYGYQPQPPTMPGNPPLPPQSAAPYQDYTSPTAYGEQPAEEALAHEVDNYEKNEGV